MRILVVIGHYLQISETFIYHQIKSLKSYPVHIAYSEKINGDIYPINAPEFKYASKPVNFLDRILSFFFRKINNIRKYSFSFFTFLRFRDYIRKNKIDIIYAQYGPNAIKVFPLKKYLGIPVVAIIHGYDGSALLNNRYYKNDLKVAAGFFNQTIFVSDQLLENFNEKKINIAKSTILPCGVDLNLFQKTKRLKKKNHIVILHLGRLVPKKGVPDLFDGVIPLLVKYQNVKLKIAGSGPDSNILINKMGTTDKTIRRRIELVGEVNHKEVYNLFNEADIFVLNSQIAPDGDTEGIPVALLEAMSMELGIVTTRHANIPDLIRHEYNGLLISEKNNEELTSAIETLIVDAEKRRFYGINARKSILNKFNINDLNKELQAILAEECSGFENR